MENRVIIKTPEGYTLKMQEQLKDTIITFEPNTSNKEPKLPMSWGDLFLISGAFADRDGDIITVKDSRIGGANVFPTREEAEASIALAQLLQLRNAWGGRYFTFDETNFRVIVDGALLSSVLAFPNIELRDRFQTTFADLIKTASPLL